MQFDLSKLLSQASSLIGRKESVVGIDIGTTSVKAVQLKKAGGQIVLESYGSIALGPYVGLDVAMPVSNPTEEIVTKAIKELFKASNISSKDCLISIPSSSSLVFMLDIPAEVAKSRLAEIIPIEARKHVPISLSEVSLDWWPVPKDPLEEEQKKKTEVLVTATFNEVVNKYNSIVRSVGVKVEAFEIEIFSIVRSVIRHDLSPVLVMDFGALKTRLGIVDRGIVKRLHTINRGSYEITRNIANSLQIPFIKAEELKRDAGLLGGASDDRMKNEASEIAKISVEFILAESQNAMANYERTYNRPVSKVIITGGGAILKGFLDRASDKFKIETIYGDPFYNVKSPEFLGRLLKVIGPEFAVSSGLALRKWK